MLKSLPFDMYKKILFKLDVKTILNMCETDQQISKLCSNDDLWRQYLVSNYDPLYYGMSSWTLENIQLKNLKRGKNLLILS